MKRILIVAIRGHEYYEFFVVREDEDYWYSGNDVRFPKSKFREQ